MSIVDAHREGRAHRLVITLHHLRQIEFVEPLAWQRKADQSGGFLSEECDLLGSRKFGSHDQVAFVLTILIVDHNHDRALGEFSECVVDGIEHNVSHLTIVAGGDLNTYL